LFASGAIIYAYVGGDPVNAVDPLGLETVSEQSGIPIPMPTIPLPGTRDENDPSPRKDVGEFFQGCLNTVDRMLSTSRDDSLKKHGIVH
jgi:hypothetical protein